MTEKERKTVEYTKMKIDEWKKEKKHLDYTDVVIEIDEDYKRDEILLNLIQKLEAENKKKDNVIELMAPQIYLTQEQQKEIQEDVYIHKHTNFSSFVKQYFERKAEEEL